MLGTASRTGDATAQAAGSGPLLALRGVYKRFGDVAAVAGVDLEVARGTFVTLLGPSGSGKTTLLNLVAGFERPDAGEIVLAGQRVDALPPHKRELNTVFQGYALFPHLDVAANVAFGLRMRKVARDEIRARVAEALEMVQITPLAKRKVDQLSGGQQQRVALARALVNRPALVLLDEPLSALDAQLRKAMQLELTRIQEQVGITFLYVTHDQEEALVMSDLVCLVNGGQIEQLGSPDDLYHRPRSRFAASFLGRNNFLEGAVEGGVFRFGEGGELPLGARIESGPATIAVRPERLCLGADDEGLPGVVVATRFLGDRVEADLRLDAGPTVSLFLNGRTVAASDRVRVQIPAEHCAVVERGGPAAAEAAG